MGKFYYFGIIQYLIEETDLTLIDLRVFCKIANLPEGMICSLRAMSQFVGVGKSSVQRSLDKLSGLGVIRKTDLGWDVSSELTCPSRGTECPSDGTKVSQPWDKSVPAVGHTTNTMTSTNDRNTRGENSKKKKAKKKKKTKPKTPFDIDNSITPEQYESILRDSELADGDLSYLRRQSQTMADYYDDTPHANWNARLKNWIRKARYQFNDPPNRKNGKPTSFDRNIDTLKRSAEK